MGFDEEHCSFNLYWNNECYVSSDYEPESECVLETKGKIICVNEKDESRDLVGKFSLCYINVELAINTGYPLDLIMDDHSGDVSGYYDPIFGSEAHNFSDQIVELFPYELFDNNLLILNRLEILSQYRGNKLGLKVIYQLIKRFSAGAGIVAIEPSPLQFLYKTPGEHLKDWWAKMNYSSFSTDQKASTERLREHYSELGFIHLENTDKMVLSTARKNPSI